MPFTELQQAEAASRVRPSRWARYSINHTKKTCGITCAIPLLAIVIIASTRSFTLNNPTAEDYFVRDDIRTRLDDARTAAMAQFPYQETQVVTERLEESNDFGMEILLRPLVNGNVPVYDGEVDAPNVLTRESLALLKRAEDAVFLDEQYKQFCLFDQQARDCKGDVPVCALPNSILNNRHLYGVYTDDDDRLCGRKDGFEPVTQEEFDRFLDSLVVEQNGQSIINPADSRFITKDATPDSLETWAIRSRLLAGVPFSGYTSVDDRMSDQEKAYEDWATSVRDTVNNLSTDQLNLFLFGTHLANSDFGDIALRDLSFSVAAMVLVFIIIWIHTGSGFLATVAMGQIFLSFPLAYVFYRFIFRQLYFAALQVLAIFLLLGIGADDVFVFTDAWKQATVVLGKCDLVTRMSWTYRRAVRAMSVTSITTAAAFFVTATSPIMPVGTLGVWAGLLIMFQFFLVITIYPCAVAIWERFWRQRLFVRGFKKPDPEEAAYELNLPFYQRFLPKKWRSKPGDNVAEYRAIERFFRGPWLKLINKVRYVLVIVAVALAAVSVYLATRLEPPTDNEAFLPESHPTPVAFDTIGNAFPTSKADQQLRVRVAWGILDVDREGTSKFEPNDAGKAILDGSFDLKSAAAQRHVSNTCNVFGDNEELIFQGDTIDETVRCWIRDYKKWRQNELGKGNFETFTSESELADELIRFGEFKLANGSQPYIRYLNNQDIAFSNDNSRVVFTEVRFVGSTRARVPETVMWPVYQEWQRILGEQNAEGPGGVNQAIATGGFAWKWQITQRVLVRSMFIGIGVMMGVAFVALTLSTLNWAVAILATLVIAGIVSMLMGIISLLGWELGITETVGVVISIGYSFDGAAHIATAYVESRSETRYDRTKDALTDLGISIMFGAISTLFAGFMLFPAVITFFVKFAGLIVATVSLSMVWSLVFLPAILLIVGPTGKFGSLAPLLRRLLRGMSCKRHADEDFPQDDVHGSEEEDVEDKMQSSEDGVGSSGDVEDKLQSSEEGTGSSGDTLR